MRLLCACVQPDYEQRGWLICVYFNEQENSFKTKQKATVSFQDEGVVEGGGDTVNKEASPYSGEKASVYLFYFIAPARQDAVVRITVNADGYTTELSAGRISTNIIGWVFFLTFLVRTALNG